MLQYVTFSFFSLLKQIIIQSWDLEVAKQFAWIDSNATNSKVLISSRIRNVLEGGEIIDVLVPSKSNAVKMLLSTAGMDVGALQDRDEIGQIVDLCKRLPLTIGVAGKLIRQLMNGATVVDASDWEDVLALLEEELVDSDSSIEESVIRASLKAIPAKIRPKVTQLFHGFALAPEDTQVPLAIMGMLYEASSEAEAATTSAAKDGSRKTATTTTLSRLQIRRCLKTLIDRSLVLGTVDRPQLHDVMLVYVQKQWAEGARKAAQREVVEAMRKADRSPTTMTGQYMQQYIRHHTKDSYDDVWAKGPQALSWLEDNVGGVQDMISEAAALLLPVEELAKEAEAAGSWWQAALRWNALASVKIAEAGQDVGGAASLKLAVAASAHVVGGVDGGGGEGSAVAQFDLDTFNLYALKTILKSWDPEDIAVYSDRLDKALDTPAGRSRPLIGLGVAMVRVWYPGLLSGDQMKHAHGNWTMVSITSMTHSITSMTHPTPFFWGD